jgi:hypothetical protein
MQTDGLPFLAAVNALLKITHAFLDISSQHVILIDLGSASLDDLVANLRKKTLHSLWCVVENT